MTTLTYGKNHQITFQDLAEKYKFIGYLTNHNVFLQWEHNEQQGAWGQEGRIAFTSDHVTLHFPHLLYTAGVGNYTSRLNCNDFVQELFQLGFSKGNTQNTNLIRGNIQPACFPYFDAGCSL